MRIQAIRRLAISGGLLAAAFAISYPLVAIPNVELLTLAFFSVGYTFGPLWGMFVASVGETLYATFNPLGAPIAPVWVAQVIGMTIAGALGGFIGRYQRRLHWTRRSAPLILAAAGVLATLIFDLLTNLAMAWAIGPFWAVLVAAIPFAAIHIASNALLFFLIFPILRRWLIASPNSAVEQPTSV